jgi:hypothetical protein
MIVRQACTKYAELASYKDAMRFSEKFWEVRNEEMARNLVSFINENSIRRSVVLCGATHRKYLKEILGRQDSIVVKPAFHRLNEFGKSSFA